MELEELRLQMGILKSKLESQDIVTDELMRDAIERKYNSIYGSFASRVTYTAVMLAGMPVLFWLIGTPVWAVLTLAGVLMVAFVALYFNGFYRRYRDFSDATLLEISQQIQASERRMNETWRLLAVGVGCPLATLSDAVPYVLIVFAVTLFFAYKQRKDAHGLQNDIDRALRN